MTRPSAASRVPTRCPVTVGPPGASALSFRVTRLPTCRLISCGVIASLLLSAFQPSADFGEPFDVPFGSELRAELLRAVSQVEPLGQAVRSQPSAGEILEEIERPGR